MINKQNMWFLTLFAIILVLSIYYVTLSDDSLSKILEENTTEEVISTNNEDNIKTVETTDSLAALRVSKEEESEELIEELQTILLNSESSLEEKNDAYNSIEQINIAKGKENKIEKIIKEEMNLNSVVTIESDNIYVTVSNKNHSKNLANNIIKKIQEGFDKEVYVTVNFDISE